MSRSVENAQTSFRARASERDLSEERNLLNCNIQLDGLNLGTDGSAGHMLLSEAKLELLKGYHYGLIGRNGVGKTTLLKAIHHHRINGMWKHLRTVYVDDQAAVDAKSNPDQSCLDFLLASHQERKDLLEKLVTLLEDPEEEETNHQPSTEEAFDLDLLDRVHQQLRLLGADAASARGTKILQGLLLDPKGKIGTLSGGWLHRLALAQALFVEADIVLLDEPTNHLDLKALRWLATFLARTSSTVVVVSHDAAFLNVVTDHIIVFEDKRLCNYKGNFARYLETRAAKFEKHKRMYLAQEKRRSRWTETIEHLSERASRGDESCARMITARKAALKNRLGASLDGKFWQYGRMGPRPEILAPKEEEPFEFLMETDVSDLPDCDAPSKGVRKSTEQGTLLIAQDLGFAWPTSSTILFDRLDLKIGVGTRLALVGANGSGKTTLMKVLLGKEKPSRGTIMTWDGLRIGFFEQDSVALLCEAKGVSALEWICSRHGWTGVKGEKSARKLLAGLGLTGLVAENQELCTLSNGQRSRVLLADVIADDPHVLFLDEPSNHLDAESHSALVTALECFEGGIVVATHDQVLAQTLACEYLCFLGSPTGDLKLVKEYDDFLTEAGIPKEWAENAGGDEFSQDALSSKEAQKNFKDKRHEENKKQAALTNPSALPKEDEDPNKPKPAVDGPQLKVKEAPKFVGCRYCQGGHFTHQCPDKEQYEEATAKKNTKKQQSGGALPPTKVKSKDGQGDWKVAVSKSTMRRIKKQ